jgi:hypothetical protein
MNVDPIIKDVLIPVLSPFVAVLTLALFVRQERRKLTIQRETELDIAARSIYRDLRLLRDEYQLLGLMIGKGESVEAERISTIQNTSQRIFKYLLEDPAVFEVYFLKPKARVKRTKLPLLLGELQIKLTTSTTSLKIDTFVLFGVYLLLYIYDKNPKSSLETQQILDQIAETSPEFYGAFWDLNPEAKPVHVTA